MATWEVWKSAYDLVTLRDDGDPIEIRGSKQHNLDKDFPNYELFWRYHVVPATYRPANFDLRADASKEVSSTSSISHAIWVDLVNAADSLGKALQGDLGGERFRNYIDAMKSDGDALQKFSDFQVSIEGPKSANAKNAPKTWLARACGRGIAIFDPGDLQTKWLPWRERYVSYRNYLTHMTTPPYFWTRETAPGVVVPFVLKKEFMGRKNYPNWQEQEQLASTNPERWAKLVDVCEELHRDTVAWLNGAYAEVRKAVDPLVSDQAYQRLWGWETSRFGRPGRPTGTICVGSGMGP
jgi:hypothetical protein